MTTSRTKNRYDTKATGRVVKNSHARIKRPILSDILAVTKHRHPRAMGMKTIPQFRIRPRRRPIRVGLTTSRMLCPSRLTLSRREMPIVDRSAAKDLFKMIKLRFTLPQIAVERRDSRKLLRMWPGLHLFQIMLRRLWPSLFADLEQFHVENERRIWGDHAASPTASIAQFRRNSQLPLSTDFHSPHTFIPAFDNLPRAESKPERLAAIHRAVELLAIGQPSGVMYFHGLARNRSGAGADHDVPVLQARRGRRRLTRNLGWRRGLLGEQRGRRKNCERARKREDLSFHSVSP